MKNWGKNCRSIIRTVKKTDLNIGQKFSSPSKRRPIKDPWSLCVMQKALRAKHLSSHLLAAPAPMPDQLTMQNGQ